MKTFPVVGVVLLAMILPTVVWAGSYSSSSKGSYSKSDDEWLEKGGSDFQKEKEQIRTGMKGEAHTVKSSSANSGSTVSSKDGMSINSSSTIRPSGTATAPAAQKTLKKQAGQEQVSYREKVQKALKEWTGKDEKVTAAKPDVQTQADAAQK